MVYKSIWLQSKGQSDQCMHCLHLTTADSLHGSPSHPTLQNQKPTTPSQLNILRTPKHTTPASHQCDNTLQCGCGKRASGKLSANKDLCMGAGLHYGKGILLPVASKAQLSYSSQLNSYPVLSLSLTQVISD